MNQWFDVGTFVSPIITTPFLILFLTRYRHRFDLIFLYLWVLTVIHGVLNTWGKDSVFAQAVAMMVFFVLRPLKWAACCEFLHHPPYQLDQYGRLYGVLSVACAFGAVCLYPLTWMSYYMFEGSFFNANILLTMCEASVIALPIYLHLSEYECDSGNHGTCDKFRSTYQSAYLTSIDKTPKLISKPGKSCDLDGLYAASDHPKAWRIEKKAEVSFHPGDSHCPLYRLD